MKSDEDESLSIICSDSSMGENRVACWYAPCHGTRWMVLSAPRMKTYSCKDKVQSGAQC